MRPRSFAFAVAIVRAWTRAYTWRLRAPIAQARRAEVESDLWEFQHDRSRRRRLDPALHVFLRLLLGIPDDLSWRADHSFIAARQLRRAAALAAAALLGGLWIFSLALDPKLPDPPATPFRHGPRGFGPYAGPDPALPPPPPPPPPPEAPSVRTAGVGR